MTPSSQTMEPPSNPGRFNVRVVSRDLGVRYILEGSVRKVGNRVRITAQLIDGIKGGHVWADKYDGELQDIFDLQDNITLQVVAATQAKMWRHVGEKSKKIDHPDLGTWDLLVRGNKLFSEFTKESLAAAEKIYRRAIASDPTSCTANTSLADVLTIQLWMGYVSDTTTIASEALDLAKRAVSLDVNNEYAHEALGNIQDYRGKLDLAIEEFNRAIELNPNCSYAYGLLGDSLGAIDPDESIKNNEMAIRINPQDPSIFFRFTGIAMAHFEAGRYLEASQWAHKSVQRKPNYRIGHAYLAASLAQANRLEEAKESVNNYLESFPNETISNILESAGPGITHRFEEGLRKAELPE